MNGDNTFFKQDGTSTFTDPGWVKGDQWLIDLYKNGYAPKDSINWGFNEIVAGFYSGTCAMLDQDPDALIAVAERMKAEDYDIVPFPKGPAGKAFPTIGYGSWAMFSNSKAKDLSWKLIATLIGPEGDVIWNKKIGALPIYQGADKDPFYANPKFKGWFEELGDKNVTPTVMPTYLPEFAYWADSIVPKTGQQALLGQVSAADVTKQWADYLSKAQQKYLAAKK
jgi:multiple sugar transport system substrate-binding protein